MEFKELNFNRIKAIFLKEFIHIKRDARSLIITMIAPIVLLILYGYAVTFDIKRIDLGVVDYDNSKESRDLISKFMSSSYFEIYTEGFNNMNINLKAIRINRIRAILIIPYDFSKSIKKRQGNKNSINNRWFRCKYGKYSIKLCKNNCRYFCFKYDIRKYK